LTPDPNPLWKPQVHFHTGGRPKIHFPPVEMDLFRLIDLLKVNEELWQA